MIIDLTVLINYLFNELKINLKQSIMKKVLLALTVIATLSLTSCKQVNTEESTEACCDSTMVDSVSVDTTAVDTTQVDTTQVK